MGLTRMRGTVLAGMVGLTLLLVGCTETTRINFQGPSGAVLTVDGKPHHIPAAIDISRPKDQGGAKRHPVTLVFTSQASQEIRAQGYIDMFGYHETELDKASVNTCVLDEAQLVKIPQGTTVVFRGQSASRQALYELTLKP
jgi:hypothetical protein